MEEGGCTFSSQMPPELLSGTTFLIDCRQVI